MPVLDKNDNIKVNEYVKFIKNFPSVSFMQDYGWGNVKSSWIKEYIYMEKDGKIYAAMSCLIKKLPLLKHTIIYVPRGPVCDIKDLYILKQLIKEADDIVKKYKAIVIKFDPEIEKNEDLKYLYKINNFKIINKQSTLIQPKYNMVIDIQNKTEEDLIKSFASKTRYNIKYGYKKSVKTFFSNDIEDLKIFYELYVMMCKRKSIEIRDYSYFETLFNSYSKDELRIYLAKHENDFLAAAIALNYGGCVYYLYGATSDLKRELKASYVVQLEMIRWGLEKKCKTYNLGGLLNPVNENGLFRFKVGFTGDQGIKEYVGEINKVYNYPLYFLYNFVLPKFRSIVRRIKGLKTQ